MKIVIDGNIGSGKTTQLNLLANIGFNVEYEKIDKWHLDLFYSDMNRWALVFHLIVLQSLKPSEIPNTIFERCPLSSKEIFWKSMNKFEIEDKVYQNCFELQGWGPDLYILLDKPPDICYKHIQKRSQIGDASINLNYLQNSHSKYLSFFDKLTCHKYKIDATQSIRKINQIIIGHLVQHGCILSELANEYITLDVLKSSNKLLGPY